MHIICPKCFTKYNIPDNKIAKEQVLKCCKCSHKWHYSPPVVFVPASERQELQLNEKHLKKIDDRVEHYLTENLSDYQETLKNEIVADLNANLAQKNTELKQALIKNQSLSSKLVMILLLNIIIFITLLILYIYHFS